MGRQNDAHRAPPQCNFKLKLVLARTDTNGVMAASPKIQYVLETSDGWFQRHHVGVGSVIRTEKGSLHETYFPNRR
jgi:hypothetical protein